MLDLATRPTRKTCMSRPMRLHAKQSATSGPDTYLVDVLMAQMGPTYLMDGTETLRATTARKNLCAAYQPGIELAKAPFEFV